MEKEKLKKIIDEYLIPAIRADINHRLQGIRERFMKIEERIKKLEKPPGVTEKEARKAYAYIAVGQVKVDGFLMWLKQLGVKINK